MTSNVLLCIMGLAGLSYQELVGGPDLLQPVPLGGAPLPLLPVLLEDRSSSEGSSSDAVRVVEQFRQVRKDWIVLSCHLVCWLQPIHHELAGLMLDDQPM